MTDLLMTPDVLKLIPHTPGGTGIVYILNKSYGMTEIHQTFRRFAPRRLQVQIKSIKKLDW